MSANQTAPGHAAPDHAAPDHPTVAPLAWQRPDVVIPAILLLAFLVMLTLVAARPTPLTAADTWIRTHVQSTARIHAPTPRHWPVINVIANLGSTVPALPTLALATAATAWLRRTPRPLYAAAFAYAVLVGGVFVLKATSTRPGPGQTTLPADALGFFPSGHTAKTLMCYGTCALLLTYAFPTTPHLRPAVAAAFTTLALAVGAALVWQDYHWTSDVLGSYALCGAALFGVAAILGFHAPTWRRQPPPLSD